MLVFLAVFGAITRDRRMGQVRSEKGCRGHFLAVFVQPVFWVARLDGQVGRLKGTVGVGSSNRPTSSNLFPRGRVRVHARICTTVIFYKIIIYFLSDKVRRLDGARWGAGCSRPTCSSNLDF